MDLNLNLGYIVDEGDRLNPSFKTNTAISISLLRTALNSVKGGQREGHKDRNAIRVAARVVNSITKASNAKSDKVSFDVLELKHVHDTLKEWALLAGVPSSLAGWYEELLTHVEKLVEEGEKQADAKKSGN